MIVKIINYGKRDEKNFIEYKVSDLGQKQLQYLKSNLDEEIKIDGEGMILTMYFDDRLYPFQSEVAQFRLDDFIAREEIEMNVFLSSFLEDMK